MVRHSAGEYGRWGKLLGRQLVLVGVTRTARGATVLSAEIHVAVVRMTLREPFFFSVVLRDFFILCCSRTHTPQQYDRSTALCGARPRHGMIETKVRISPYPHTISLDRRTSAHVGSFRCMHMSVVGSGREPDENTLLNRTLLDRRCVQTIGVDYPPHTHSSMSIPQIRPQEL